MQKLISKNNKTLLEKFIPEKGSAYDYHSKMMFTDPKDEAFNYPSKYSLSNGNNKNK